MSKEELMQKIESVTELLYQQKISEGYAILPELLSQIGSYVGLIEESDKQQSILEALNEALAAMQQNDTTLLADILQYELGDLL